MANKRELIKIFRTIILEIFPELKGYHAPIRAKVVKVNETGGKIDEFNKRYSVDVQPLNQDGTVDENAPEIPDVEIPVVWAGAGRGMFCLPVVSSIVRVAFYYNDPAYPFVDAILGDGFNIPDHAVGSLIIQHSNGKKFEITVDGTVLQTMDTKIIGDVIIDGTLSVSKDTTLQAKLSVGDSADIKGNTTIEGITNINGNAVIKQTLEVATNITYGGSLIKL